MNFQSYALKTVGRLLLFSCWTLSYALDSRYLLVTKPKLFSWPIHDLPIAIGLPLEGDYTDLSY